MEVICNNIKKEYNGRVVLDIHKLKIESGNIYCILGTNGSGKTTLLKAISNNIKLSNGEILYNNKKFDNNIRRDIGVMNQNPYMFGFSVYKNIISGLKFRKLSKETILTRYNKYKSIFNIENILQNSGKDLSLGEKAKVALIRTAILETSLILLDEPTASMDFEGSRIAEKFIVNLKNKNKIIIVISHNINQIRRISDKVIFLDHGKLIFSDDTDLLWLKENQLLNNKLSYI